VNGIDEKRESDITRHQCLNTLSSSVPSDKSIPATSTYTGISNYDDHETGLAKGKAKVITVVVIQTVATDSD